MKPAAQLPRPAHKHFCKRERRRSFPPDPAKGDTPHEQCKQKRHQHAAIIGQTAHLLRPPPRSKETARFAGRRHDGGNDDVPPDACINACRVLHRGSAPCRLSWPNTALSVCRTACWCRIAATNTGRSPLRHHASQMIVICRPVGMPRRHRCSRMAGSVFHSQSSRRSRRETPNTPKRNPVPHGLRTGS